MTAREWPEDDARAWLLRTAASFIRDGGLEAEARRLIRGAAGKEFGATTKSHFRRLLAEELSWKAREIDSAVAEVYEQGSPEATIRRLTHERNELGRAIAEAAQRGGIYNGEAPLTGPDLILLARDMGDALAKRSTTDGLRQHMGAAPLSERFTGKSDGGNCVPCERPTNVFLSPGGVEPEEWRTK